VRAAVRGRVRQCAGAGGARLADRRGARLADRRGARLAEQRHVGASGSAGGAGGWCLAAQELERIQASGARRVVASPSGGRLQERAGVGQGPGEAQASPNKLAASGARLGRVSRGWSTDDGGRRASTRAACAGSGGGRTAGGAREQGAPTAQSV
jgi:hypothetical protein